MTVTIVSQRSALLTFLFCIAYSLVLSAQASAGHGFYLGLERFGTQVITQYIMASACMLIVWQTMQSEHSHSSVQLVFLVAIAARLLLLFTEPYTSNDVDRYLFDGRLAFEGIDPYSLAHNSPELSELRSQWQPPAEHAKYTTLYPPAALALFSFAASFGLEYALLVWKLLTTIASIGIVFISYAVLKHANKLKHFALVSLSPLLILEAGEGLHVDVFSALVVLLIVRSWQRQKWMLAGVLIGLGALIKMLPALLILPILVCLKTWNARLKLALMASATWLGGYLLSFAYGLKPVGSISVFFEKWRSGSAFFLWFEPYLTGHSMLYLVLVLLIVGLLALSYITKKTGPDSPNFPLLLQLFMALPLLLTPVIFPWYLLPVIALTALRPSAFILAWSISLPLLYEVLNQFVCCQQWNPADWPVHTIGISLTITAFIDWLLFSRKAKVNLLSAKNNTIN